MDFKNVEEDWVSVWIAGVTEVSLVAVHCLTV
jgi:hypothetical protein